MQLPCAMGSMQLFFETSSFIRGLLTTTHIQWASAGRGQISRWILKFSAKKVIFLVSRGKNQLLPLSPPPGKNPSEAHAHIANRLHIPACSDILSCPLCFYYGAPYIVK